MSGETTTAPDVETRLAVTTRALEITRGHLAQVTEQNAHLSLLAESLQARVTELEQEAPDAP